jgi:hypothetical protein
MGARVMVVARHESGHRRETEKLLGSDHPCYSQGCEQRRVEEAGTEPLHPLRDLDGEKNGQEDAGEDE